LAEMTLARSMRHSGAAHEARKMHMLAELGLADEAIDVEDEEEEDDELLSGEEDGDDSEKPIFSNNGKPAAKQNGHTSINSQLPVYGYKDVFGKEYERRRQQLINSKGYDRYLSDLLARSAESLQLLRSDRNMQYPGSVEIIGELEHELGCLHQENKGLRTELTEAYAAAHDTRSPRSVASPAPPAPPMPAANGVSVDSAAASALRAQVTQLESALAARDAELTKLNVRLREAEASVHSAMRSSRDSMVAGAAEAAAGAVPAVQLEQLRAALQKKEAQVEVLTAEIQDLKGHGAKPSAVTAAEASAALASARAEQEDMQRRLDELQQQARAADEALRKREAEFATKLSEMASASEHEKAAALQKQVWSLTESHSRRVEELEAEIKQKGVIITQLQAQKAEAVKKMTDATSLVKEAKQQAAAEVKSKLDGMYRTIDELHALREGVLGELLAMQADMFNDKTISQMWRMVRDKEIAAQRKAKADSRAEVDAALSRAQEAEEALSFTREQCEQQLRIKELEAQGMIKHFQDKWRAEFEKRKKLHNQVLDLKGSIRVLCRVRPLLEKERFTASGEEPPVKCVGEESLRIINSDKGFDKEFEFDRVFAPLDGQDKVFDEVVGLVTSVLDGYNVCIMAYGQTGSGKTFTMEGPDDNPGVNSRALRELFRIAEERSQDFTYSFSASVLEIYNEQIYDLLSGSKEQDDKLDVKQGADGGMTVPGLRIEGVVGVEDVSAVIARGKNNRSTFATNMNEHSSRSHLVLSVYITATSKTSNTTMRGKLHLIDLAGSERISRTGAQGDRLKEAQNINKSLSALGDVIQALQQRNAHIPYRNSKLTRLLEDSLGSSSKCIMVVNVSPAAENVPETKCSLEFASRARKVELGKAKQNIEGAGAGSGTPKPPGSLRNSPAVTPSSMSRSSSQSGLQGRTTPSK